MIAIHQKGDFAERWIRYCQKHSIDFKVVNAYDNDIVDQVFDCYGFMWHFSQINYKDILLAKQLLHSLEIKGVKVFPDDNTVWHFDDKLGQKYLFETLGIPHVPTYVFYTKSDAMNWASSTSYPKVFKLRGGAGSENVMLVKSHRNAKKLIKKAFRSGFKQTNAIGNLGERWRKYRLGKTNLKDVLKGVARLIYSSDFLKYSSREKGYVYFQDFIPGNNFDIRVVVVGDKAFAIKRLVRDNDFRASGSGNILYDKSNIDERCVEMAFQANNILKTQSIAYDFVFDEKNNPLVVEISYGYLPKGYDSCPGYWDSDMNWHTGSFDFCGWMVENLLK